MNENKNRKEVEAIYTSDRTTSSTATDSAVKSTAISPDEFFRELFQGCHEGCITITALPDRKIEHIPVTDIEKAVKRVKELGAKTDTYYNLALCEDGLSEYCRGSAETARTVVAFYADIDIKGSTHKQETLPETFKEAEDFLKELDHAPSVVINSGNGLHALWLLDTPFMINTEDEREYIRKVSSGFGVYVVDKGREKGWKLDKVQDIARMLRAPGTLNFKTDPPKECRIIECNTAGGIDGHATDGSIDGSASGTGSAGTLTRYSLYDFDKYKDYASQTTANSIKFNVNPDIIGSAERMCGKCAFIDHCIENADTLSEPLWHAFISNAALASDGEEKCHEWSRAYPGYSYTETQRKCERAMKTKLPCSCRYVRDSLGFECPAGGCCSGSNTIGKPLDFCVYSDEEQIKNLLEENLTKEDMYSDRVAVLAIKAKESFPYLYECIIDKAKALKIRLRQYEAMLNRKAAELHEAANMLEEQRPDFVIYSREKQRESVSCPRLAEHIRGNLNYLMVQNSVRDEANLHIYENGVYTFCNKKRFKGYIKKYITDYNADLLRMTEVDEVYNQLTTDLRTAEAEELDRDENIINFQNGVLNLSAMELQHHSPDTLSTIQIPCNWKGTAQPTPVFDKYLDTLVGHDEDLKQLIMEFIGVALSNVNGWRMKKALFLYGVGDTGKSQLKALVERLLGSEHCIGIDLAQLEARFGTSAIYGKRLAGSSDMSYLTISELKTFKQCTGGDDIFAEFKGGNPFGYVYSGLLWFCMNRLPKFGGDDGAWVYDRIMAVECKNAIPKEQQDKFLLDKMYAEREGIVYKAVTALKRVIENGYNFDEPECVRLNRKMYRADNNSVIGFVNELMTERADNEAIGHDERGTVAEVMRVYNFWCCVNGIGYVKNRREFKQCYAEYIGISADKCTTMRNGRTYFVKYRLNEELADEMYEKEKQKVLSNF